MGWTLSDYANLAQIISLPLAILLWLFTREHVAGFWKKRGGLVFTIVTLLALIACVRYGFLNWLGFRVHLAVWILILAAFVLASLTALVVYLVMLPPSSQAGSPPNPSSYINDTIFGVRWSWSYAFGQIDIDSFSAFCPEQGCRHRLNFAEDYQRARYNIPVSAQCPRCGFRRDFDDDRRGLIGSVAGEVERRINTGEFAQAKQ
jgi:hypothetical protein